MVVGPVPLKTEQTRQPWVRQNRMVRRFQVKVEQPVIFGEDAAETTQVLKTHAPTREKLV